MNTRQSSILWGVITLVALGGAAWWAEPRIRAAFANHDEHEEHLDGEEHGDSDDGEHEGAAIRLARDADGNAVLTVPVEVRKRIDLSLQTLAPSEHQPVVYAYGHLLEDSAQGFVLRSPIAGFLEVQSPEAWPRIGGRISASTSLCQIRPRLSAAERFDLFARLAQSRAEVDESRAELDAARSSFESKKELNLNQQVVSERTLEEALARVKTNEARLSAATDTVKLLEDALSSHPTRSFSVPLEIPREGIVSEIGARPDEAVEPGQVILRIANLASLLARIEVPAGEPVFEPAETVPVLIPGEWSPRIGQLIGAAPDVAGLTQGRAFLLKLNVIGTPLQPGLAVTAYMSRRGAPLKGVVLPGDAIIRFAGATWIYVEGEMETLQRRMVELGAPVVGGWFVSQGIEPGRRVVTRGAGILLSEELKAQIEAEAEGDE